MSSRTLSWSSALRDLKADRTARQQVREERLRSTAGLRGSPALPLSAWRGRSGRRYVVGVHTDLSLEDVGPAVVLAVARDAAGVATIVAIGCEDYVLPAGATELHVHRLAETDEERAAIIADLAPMTVAEALDGMLALYAQPGTWVPNGVVRDASGREVAWDLEAALYRVIGDPGEDNPDPHHQALVAGVSEACGVDLCAFNDAALRQEVVVAVLRAGRARP